MTAQLAPVPVAKFFSNDGFPLAFGQLTTYAAGTTTPQATYVDSTQTTQNTNPIQLNFRGECNLWLDPTKAYKLLLQDLFGNTVPGWPVDNITIGNANPSFNVIPTSDNLYTLGSASFSWANVYIGVNHAPVLDTNSGNIGYYARTAAEISASVTPNNFAYAPLDVRRYGAVGNGVADDTTAIANALVVANAIGGAVVQLMAGTHVCTATLNIPANTTLQGYGSGARTYGAASTLLNFSSLAINSDAIKSTDVNNVHLTGFAITMPSTGTGTAIHIVATAMDVYYPRLDDIYINNVSAAGKGIFFDQTAGHPIYWPDVIRSVVQGGNASDWQTKTGIQIGGAGSTIVVGCTLRAVRIWRCQTHLLLNKCDTVRGTDISLDDAQGGSGIGVHGVSAANCDLKGLRMEPGTFDTYIQWDAGSSANQIWCPNLGNIPVAKYSDSGTLNDVYGSDGSGSLINFLKKPLNLFDVRSITVGKTQSPAGTVLSLYYATTVTINPGSIAANTVYENVPSITGALATDNVLATPQSGIEAGLVHSATSVAGGVRVRIGNVTTGAVVAASRTWNILIFR